MTNKVARSPLTHASYRAYLEGVKARVLALTAQQAPYPAHVALLESGADPLTRDAMEYAFVYAVQRRPEGMPLSAALVDAFDRLGDAQVLVALDPDGNGISRRDLRRVLGPSDDGRLSALDAAARVAKAAYENP